MATGVLLSISISLVAAIHRIKHQADGRTTETPPESAMSTVLLEVKTGSTAVAPAVPRFPGSDRGVGCA
jgi:hypothetical protein